MKKVTVEHPYDAECPYCRKADRDRERTDEAARQEKAERLAKSRAPIPGTERVISSPLNDQQRKVPPWVNLELQPEHVQQALKRR